MWVLIAGAVFVGLAEVDVLVFEELVLVFVEEELLDFVDELVFVEETEELDFEDNELLDVFVLVEDGLVDVERVDVTDLEVDVEVFVDEVEEDFTDPLLLLVARDESMYISSLLPAPQYS
jgi:hypothetical protein